MPAMPKIALSKKRSGWNQLAAAFPTMTVRTAPETHGTMAGRFTEAFSYSGPTESVHIELHAENGKNVYCDRNYTFANLPKNLAGADWVQAADADSSYSAADLMQLTVKGGMTVYVAHDGQLRCPEWLENQFQPTDGMLQVNGRSMKIFAHQSLKRESITLGSNSESRGPKNANTYIVFVNAAPAVQVSDRK
ncbi:MAG TPA: hypothetical protein VFM25_10595, partial [Verrucomicrobiae bacterium]|nr:hypothetical protein [Verrucomicrobiae bacterium]